MSGKIKLKPNNEAIVPYSASERATFNVLPRGDRPPATTSDLIKKIHGSDEDQVPYHARNVLNSTIRSLIRKTRINAEPFEIETSKRRGPHPMTVKVVPTEI